MTANPLSTIPPIGPTTGMTPPPQSGRFKPIDPLRLARKHVLLLVITAIIGGLVGGGVWFLLMQKSPRYASEGQLLVTPNMTGDVMTSNTTSNSASGRDDTEAFINNQIAYIKSDEVIREALGRPEAIGTAWLASFKGNVRLARSVLQEEMLNVSMARGTTIINMSVEAPTTNDARELCEAVMAAYLTAKQIQTQNDSAELRTVFNQERDRAEEDILAIRKQMERFVADNSLDVLRSSQSGEQRTFNALSDAALSLQLALDAARGAYESLKNSAQDRQMTDAELAELKLFPSVIQREEQIRQLEEERRIMIASGMGEQHMQIKQLDRRRASVQQELDSVMQQELGRLRALKLEQASKEVEGFLGQIEALRPKLEASETSLQELNGKLSEYAIMEDRLASAKLDLERAISALNDIRIRNKRPEAARVKRYTSPTEATLVSPKITVIVPMAMFLLTGLVGGFVVLREMLDQRVRSPMDIKLLPDINLLGLIPHENEDPSGTASVQRTVERAPTGLLAESYRQVRTAVLSKMDRRGYKTLVCVSAQPESGTSTIVQNLATSLAYNGRSVLIVDVNFRRPSQHRLIDAPNDRGLVDILRDEADAEDVIVDHPDTSLSVLPTGRAAEAPPEMLEGPAFRGLLGQLETQYDVIIIDAPPALLTSDSQLLSKHVDAIAVVVRADVDKRGMLSRMFGQLDGQRADVLGVILNGVQSAAGGYFRKSYEDFYRYREAGSLNDKRSAKANGKKNGHANGKAAKAKRQSKKETPTV